MCNTELTGVVVIIDDQQPLCVLPVRQPSTYFDQGFLALKYARVLYVEDLLRYCSKTVLQRRLRRRIQPKDRLVVMAIAIRVGDGKLRLTNTTLATKNEPSVLLRFSIRTKDRFHLHYVRFAPDKEFRIIIRRLAEVDSSGFPEVKVILWLVRDYQERLAQFIHFINRMLSRWKYS